MPSNIGLGNNAGSGNINEELYSAEVGGMDRAERIVLEMKYLRSLVKSTKNG